MKKLLILAMLGLFYGSRLAAVELPGPLIDSEWLIDNIDEVIVLDVRKDIKSFADGHIPGAILVNVKEIRIEREINDKNMTRMRPDPAGFEKFMRAHGINNDSTVVLTHLGKTSGQVTGAARLYWQMKYFGFDRVALLDGGNPAGCNFRQTAHNAAPLLCSWLLLI